ncbi:uncharacterized protein LOC114277423 isoform X2 [Camellia sinensis]|uniref:uncharacterized protein LOC114277423 isoform X2 n=1 Tax=Camellia sinensis TaxID=4442 RepID=UPI001036360E|nr:uncharacterized protein LOC114277423 isoform X2 [Camellia sinensis]
MVVFKPIPHHCFDDSLLLHRLFVASVVVIGSIKIVCLQVQFFQNRNVSIVIHNEWDFNVLCVRGAKANKKLIGKGKENYSGKGIKNTQVLKATELKRVKKITLLRWNCNKMGRARSDGDLGECED